MIEIGLIGKKIGMTREFYKSGQSVPVTVIKFDTGRVIHLLSKEKNGYNAVQIGFGKIKNSKLSKQMKGYFSKKNTEPKKVLKEFRVKSLENFKEGNEIGIEIFKDTKFVDIKSKTIGKGFAGAMKRHNFAGLRASHGVSISHRAHGSTGQCQDPGKVFKGKKMAGQLGNKRVTTQNVSIVSIDNNEGLILIKGSIPGSKGGFVYIKDAIKSKLPEGLPYPAGLLESNNTPESNKDNDVTKEEEKIVLDSITNKENSDQSLSMDQDSKDQISKNDKINENKDK